MLGRECPSLLALLSLHQVHQPLRVSLSALFQLKLSANLKLSAQHLFNEDRIYSLLFSFSFDPVPIWENQGGSRGRSRRGELAVGRQVKASISEKFFPLDLSFCTRAARAPAPGC